MRGVTRRTATTPRQARRRGGGAAWALAFAWSASSAVDGASATADSASAASSARVANRPPAASAAAPPLTQPALDAAVQALRDDPLLPGMRTTRQLRWKDHERAPDKPPARTADWLVELAAMLANASRLLVWGLGAVVLLVLSVSARHLLVIRRDARRVRSAMGPVSHVRDLDVRPESLPDDLGAAAWALWQRGDAHAALSLLYRGALSRLIHVHGVAVTSSTTEGECLGLARGHLSPTATAYLAELVRAWQSSTYGGRPPGAAAGQVLCLAFASRLDVRSATSPPVPKGDGTTSPGVPPGVSIGRAATIAELPHRASDAGTTEAPSAPGPAPPRPDDFADTEPGR